MAGRGQARALVEQALASAAGVVDAGTHKALEAKLKQFDATQDEEAGVAILQEIAGVLAIAQQQAKRGRTQAPESSGQDGDDKDGESEDGTGGTSDRASAPKQAAATSNAAAPSQQTRYAHVRKLMRDEPEVLEWAKDLAARLMRDNYVVLPRLLGPELAPALAHEVKAAYEEGRLSSGMLGGGRTGANTKYILSAVRGDKVGWFDEDPCHDTSQRDEMPLHPHVADSDDDDSDDDDASSSGDSRGDGVKCWRGTALKAFSRKMNTIVQLIAALVPELKHLESRSKAMVTCYPGNGARYIRHCDNPHGNGRKLTVLYYLNPDWKSEDGGKLRVFKPQRGRSDIAKGQEGGKGGGGEGEGADGESGKEEQEEEETEALEDIPPQLDTMVIFFSDTRVPHEVLPTQKTRFAVTHWFYDDEEKRRAERRGQHKRTGSQADLEIEEARLRREIERFEARYGSKAAVAMKAKEEEEEEEERRKEDEEREEEEEEGEAGEQQEQQEQQQQQQEQSLRYRVLVDDAAGTQTVEVESPATGTPARGADFDVEIEDGTVHITFHPTAAQVQVSLPSPINPDNDGHKVQFRKNAQTLHVVLQLEEN